MHDTMNTITTEPIIMNAREVGDRSRNCDES